MQEENKTITQLLSEQVLELRTEITDLWGQLEFYRANHDRTIENIQLQLKSHAEAHVRIAKKAADDILNRVEAGFFKKLKYKFFDWLQE